MLPGSVPLLNLKHKPQMICQTSARMQVSSAAEYRQVLRQHRIELDPERRADAIWEAVSAAAQGAGGQVPASSRADLLPEVTNLVESPTAVLGTFDEAFLQLPRSAPKDFARTVWCVVRQEDWPPSWQRVQSTPYGLPINAGQAWHSALEDS